jgi:hypothetical protein
VDALSPTTFRRFVSVYGADHPEPQHGRTNNMKTPAGRARKIAALVAMLERGETIVPEPRR